MSAIVASIKSSVKDAMRAKDKPRLSALRLAASEFKRVEVDERIDVDDDRALAILDKMVKQRQNSIEQYEQADRHDLADTEKFEISVVNIVKLQTWRIFNLLSAGLKYFNIKNTVTFSFFNPAAVF